MGRWEDALKRLFHCLKTGETQTCTIGESHTCFEAVKGE